MKVDWVSCEGDQWCSLLNLNLNHPHFENLVGVYIIWHAGPDPATIYVGQGKISERLKEHREKREILEFAYHGLFVTWADVGPNDRDGIESYLAKTLNPKIGTHHPDALAIQVNLPW